MKRAKPRKGGDTGAVVRVRVAGLGQEGAVEVTESGQIFVHLESRANRGAGRLDMEYERSEG